MENQNLTDPALWVDQYADKLYSFALKKVFSGQLAEDLVQETFLSALQARTNFKGESAELTWLTSILKNKIVDSFRKEKLSIIETLDDDFFRENGHWKNKPIPFAFEELNPLENKELNKILAQCLNKLPILWKVVFSLKHINDSSAEDICAKLDITKANYWVIIHRSKLNLRVCLQKNWLEHGLDKTK